MRRFDYRHLPSALFEHEPGNLNALLFEDRGKLRALEQTCPDELAAVARDAHLESVDASMRIEGIYIGLDRTRELLGGARPQTDVESQVVGYSEALRMVVDSHVALPLESGTVVKLYEALYGGRELGTKSRYRRKDYLYTQVEGRMEAVPVSPVPAFETPLVLGGACDSLADAFDAQACSPLILAAVFTVDFLCIRPFDEGNGRIARLFSELLLEKAGFTVGRYLSVDRMIEGRAMEYYDALNTCVDGWDASMNSYEPYVLFWFDVLHQAHEELFARVELRRDAGSGKAERVRLAVERADGPVTKKQLLEMCPDVSVSTVENVLGDLVRRGAVEKVGGGRSTAYRHMGA